MRLKQESEELQDLEELSRIGYVGNFEVYVNTNDSGKIPHFHYRDADNWGKFHTCICILESKYFHHGNKQDVLNSKQRKDLQQFLESESEEFEGLTNWQVLVRQWNLNNYDVKVPKDISISNYRNNLR